MTAQLQVSLQVSHVLDLFPTVTAFLYPGCTHSYQLDGAPHWGVVSSQGTNLDRVPTVLLHSILQVAGLVLIPRTHTTIGIHSHMKLCAVQEHVALRVGQQPYHGKWSEPHPHIEAV